MRSCSLKCVVGAVGPVPGVCGRAGPGVCGAVSGELPPAHGAVSPARGQCSRGVPSAAVFAAARCAGCFPARFLPLRAARFPGRVFRSAVSVSRCLLGLRFAPYAVCGCAVFWPVCQLKSPRFRGLSIFTGKRAGCFTTEGCFMCSGRGRDLLRYRGSLLKTPYIWRVLLEKAPGAFFGTGFKK